MTSSKTSRFSVLGASAFIAVVLVTLVALAREPSQNQDVELEQYSALQVGRYAVRAQRQSQGYRLDAERQISLATNSDDQASEDNHMAVEEEKRARASAYLAADAKDQIEKTLQQGRDLVKESTKNKAKAGRISDKAGKLMEQAEKKLKEANRLERAYKAKLKQYSKVVEKVEKAKMERQEVLDKINTAGIQLADDMTAYSKAAVGAGKTAAKLKVDQDRAALASLETQHSQVNVKAEKASNLASEYQPLIIAANRNERDSQNNYAVYTKLRHAANRLYSRASELMDRADSVDGLIQETEKDLKAKRKDFLHYKNRAETEMAISLHAEDQEDQLRRSARKSRYMAGQLFDKARRLDALSQKGLNEVMRQQEEASPDMSGLQTGFEPGDAKLANKKK